jgi:hypothetical protein
MSIYGSGDAIWLGALVRHPAKRYGLIIDTNIREDGWRYLHVRWLDVVTLDSLAGDGEALPIEEWLLHTSVVRVQPANELRIIDEARRYIKTRRSR